MFRPSHLRRVVFPLALALLAAPAGRGAPGAAADSRARFADSVREIPTEAPSSRPRRVRESLTATERAAGLDLVISLRMRHLDQLRERARSGPPVGQAEMEANFLPERADYDRVVSWLTSQGFAVTLVDSNHTNIFVRGSVSQASAAFQTEFARVATASGEFTSAVAAPSLPREISGPVLGIDGLQPHIRMRAPRPRSDAVVTAGGGATVADVLAAYGIPATLDGSGQCIAVIMDGAPLGSDLAAFWQASDVHGLLGNYAPVNVLGGGGSADLSEVTLDSEWATGIAPGAQLRVYATPTTGLAYVVAACNQILNEGLATVVSYSASIPEDEAASSSIQAASQVFAQMAARGITVVVSAGDRGSNPDPASGTLEYSPSGPLTAEYPASDPSVTGVGGTALAFNAGWTATGETVWSTIGTAASPNASGGGLSSVFARPPWQSGPGVPAGSMRCVPDVSAMAVAAAPGGLTGAFCVVNGQSRLLSGTSLSTPIWAGIVALIGQARASAGLPVLGLLGPHLYPLIGSSAFQDITSGSNGAYAAGLGYDLCSGIGTPRVTNLIEALLSAPSFTLGPSGIVFATAGQVVTLATAASGPGTLSYQWQAQALGSKTWRNVTDGAGISGATTPTLTLTAAPFENGLRYQCVVRNAVLSDTSTAATLIVSNPITLTTWAGSPDASSPVAGSLAAARFSNNLGIAVDAAGAVYVADFGWAIITKISGGAVATLAGSPGQKGSADGAGAAARFNGPWGIAVDPAGNVFVSDSGNNTIRKIAPDGTVSTLAGTAGVTGKADGAGPAASFNNPTGLALDPAGNLYVCDTNNSTIRKITPAGVVTTLAGSPGVARLADGTGPAAAFSYPMGIAASASGDLFVADSSNCAIRRVTPAGVVTTFAGGYPGAADGIGAQASFNLVYGLAVDPGGDVFVADTLNQLIREVSPAGVVTTIAGIVGRTGSTDGTGPAALLSHPDAVAVTAGGQLYVADTQNFTIRTASVPVTPLVTAQPASQLVGPGASVSFTVAASGVPAPGYQWQKDGADLAGATGATYTIPSAQFADSGTYTVIVSNAAGSVTSAEAILTVSTIPVFRAQPQSQAVSPGASATFSVAVAGTPDPTCQWYFNGQAISGATGLSYTIPSVHPSDSGSYSVVATNALGSAASLPAMLTASAASGGPALLAQPASQTLAPGATAVLSVAASGGTGLGYQWYRDGAIVAGATAPNLVITAAPAAAGAYTCLLVNASGSVLSGAAALAVRSTANPGRLINLSVNTEVDPSGLTMGLVVGGSGTAGTQTLLIRAGGPALTAYGLTGVLADPQLTVMNGSTPITSNAGWGTPASNAVAVNQAQANTGAGLVYANTASADSALVLALGSNPGYTVLVRSKSGGSGRTLAEVYDDTPANTYTTAIPRLINVSCRITVGANASLTEGFYVGGTTSRTVLIRAIGPGLAAFGVTGAMSDPQLTVYSGQTVIASNTGWGGDPQMTAAMTAVGALPNPPQARDSAVLLTLPPGGYTAVATSASGAAGNVLLDIYEVP